MAKQLDSNGKNIKKMKFTRNDLRVLTAIRDCGFVRINQLREMLLYRGFKQISVKYTYTLANRLAKLGLVALNRYGLLSDAGVYTATSEGRELLCKCGCGLDDKVNADPLKSSASFEHYVTLNDIMLKLYKVFPVSYWLSDFLVQSENQLRKEQGFAKDYDAVCEIVVNKKQLILAIEYEHTLKNRASYREVFESYMKDPYIQLVIFIVDSPKWIGPITESIKVPGRRLCFVTTKQFLTQTFNSMQVSRWNGPTIENVPLAQAMDQATENKYTEYLVSHTPPK
jgi:hypothetical protein